MTVTPPPSIGRIVHVCTTTKAGDIVLRPAIIVRVWPDGSGGVASYVNVQIFMDGDGSDSNDGIGTQWKSSATYDPDLKNPLTWCWPPRV
mgnify:CR=1 FL=1